MAIVAGLSAAVVILPAATASAHEVRTVGAYRFTVGFGNEPAYLGQENFVQFFLATTSGKPVTNPTNSLKLDVEVGNQKKALALEPSFDPDTGLGTPGEYDAFFFPTTIGKYTFHFHGSIHGQKIDQSFTSGPESFSEVESPASVEFPAKVPTTSDIAGLLNRALPRFDRQLAEERSSLESKIDSARLFGIIGIAVGAVGLAAAGAALALRRRT
jgi:hypothetical protein